MNDFTRGYMRGYKDAQKEALAQTEQEPAFYAHDGYLMTPERAKFLGFPLDSILALYTTPPQPKPLTDEQIIHIASTPDGSQATTKGYVIPFARAIEAAHGIKE